MSLAYVISIHPDRRLALFRFWGEVTVAQATRAFLDYTRDPLFDAGHVMLTDGRAVSRVEADFQGIFYNVSTLLPQLRRFRAGALSIVLVADPVVEAQVETLAKVLGWSSQIRMLSVWSESEALRLAEQSGAAAATGLDDLLVGD